MKWFSSIFQCPLEHFSSLNSSTFIGYNKFRLIFQVETIFLNWKLKAGTHYPKSKNSCTFCELWLKSNFRFRPNKKQLKMPNFIFIKFISFLLLYVYSTHKKTQFQSTKKWTKVAHCWRQCVVWRLKSTLSTHSIGQSAAKNDLICCHKMHLKLPPMKESL